MNKADKFMVRLKSWSVLTYLTWQNLKFILVTCFIKQENILYSVRKKKCTLFYLLSTTACFSLIPKLVCVCVCVCAQLLSHVWLCDPMNCSPPGFSVHGIFQARILEQVDISFCRGSSWPIDWTCVSCISCIDRWILYRWATWEALIPKCSIISI